MDIREYRGKDKDGNIFYGYYINIDKPIIVNNEGYHDVILESVSQYTGNITKSGDKIYENDMLEIYLPLGGFWGNIKRTEVGIVRYESDYGAFIVEWKYSKNQHHVILNCDIAFESKLSCLIKK